MYGNDWHPTVETSGPQDPVAVYTRITDPAVAAVAVPVNSILPLTALAVSALKTLDTLLTDDAGTR